MTPTRAHEIVTAHEDRAITVGVEWPGRGSWLLEDDLAELGRLADTAGVRVVGTVTQKLDRPNPKTFVGEGKAHEIARVAQENDANLVLVDEDLTPSQQANLGGLLAEVRVMDRTALILEIFAQHATSREGKLQVELAQLEYLLPRLRGMWGHLERDRLGGGRGARFGAGESQLETDRRLARRRIADLKRDLEHVAEVRHTQRTSRARSGVFRVALVGYTNAGKSTLLNTLTDAGVLVEDQLFATLDPTTRRLDLPDGRVATLTDTVGFINKLPHGLVEAFKSTLDEVREADLLMHVVDAAHPNAEAQVAAVRVVLDELGAASKPQLVAYNKADLLDAGDAGRLAAVPGAVLISAATGRGLEALLERVAVLAARGDVTLTVLVPYERGDLVRTAHEHAHVLSTEHTNDGTLITLAAPPDVAARFTGFESNRPPKTTP